MCKVFIKKVSPAKVGATFFSIIKCGVKSVMCEKSLIFVKNQHRWTFSQKTELYKQMVEFCVVHSNYVTHSSNSTHSNNKRKAQQTWKADIYHQGCSGYVTFGLSYNFDSASWMSSNVKATKAYEQIITRGEVYAYVRYNNQVKACVITTNELK